MKIAESKNLSLAEKQELLELWNNEYPEILNYSDIGKFETYLKELKDHYHLLLSDSEGKIVGWYFDFIRDDERWFLLIVDSAFQGRGSGSKLLELARTKRKELHGWVIQEDVYKRRNGRYYSSPVRFYEKQNFSILDDIRLEKEGLSAVKIIWKASAGFGDKVG